MSEDVWKGSGDTLVLETLRLLSGDCAVLLEEVVDENGKVVRSVPDELFDYDVRLFSEGKLKMKVAYSKSIDWFGTVCAIDDGKWTTRNFVCNVKLDGFVDDGIYPMCLVCAKWIYGEREIKIAVPMRRCEMFRESDGGMRMRCRLSLHELAFHLTPERYAELAAIVRDKNMMPCIEVEVTYFNKSGVDALVAKMLELAVKRQKKGLVFNVETGNVSTAKVEQYLSDLQQQYQKTKNSDINRGEGVVD